MSAVRGAADEAHALPDVARRLLDLAIEPALVVALDGTVVHANEAAGDLLGRQHEELAGTPLVALTVEDPERVDEVLDLWATSSALRPGPLRVRVAGNLEAVPLHCEGARLPEAGLVYVRCRERGEALERFEDLTRQIETKHLRELKRRLEDTIEELRTANRQLGQANVELDRYASVVSHDLRTPLATISGFVDLLEEDADRLDPDTTAAVAAIGRSVARMREVIDALLTLARVGQAPADAPPVRLGDVLDGVLEQLWSELRESGGEVERGELAVVAVDRTHLAQVLQNLIANAIRFRDPDRPLRVRVDASRTDGMVEVVVSDNGRGIAPVEREEVFEPLRRGRAAVGIPGTGIGLATCRKIVLLYGGDIRFVEPRHGGATVAFTVPAG